MEFNFHSFGTPALKELLEKKLKVEESKRNETQQLVIEAIQLEIEHRTNTNQS